MLDHILDNWLLYAAATGFGLVIWGVVALANAEHDRVAACYNQNMVVVRTDAGDRCVALDSLYPVRP